MEECEEEYFFLLIKSQSPFFQKNLEVVLFSITAILYLFLKNISERHLNYYSYLIFWNNFFSTFNRLFKTQQTEIRHKINSFITLLNN